MAEEALGDGVKRVLDAESELAGYAKRGLQATRDIAQGEILREDENYAVLRPGQRKLGVHPKFIPDFEGRPSKRAIALGEGLSLDDIAT
jgi:N-acetylneuraminate synthase